MVSLLWKEIFWLNALICPSVLKFVLASAFYFCVFWDGWPFLKLNCACAQSFTFVICTLKKNYHKLKINPVWAGKVVLQGEQLMQLYILCFVCLLPKTLRLCQFYKIFEVERQDHEVILCRSAVQCCFILRTSLNLQHQSVTNVD